MPAGSDPGAGGAGQGHGQGRKVELKLPDNDLLLFCTVTAADGADTAKAELRDSHANITRVWRGQELIFEKSEAASRDHAAAGESWPLTLAGVYDFATTAPLEEISFILEAARMNRQVAEEGLKSQYGLAVGKSMDAQIRQRMLSDDMPGFGGQAHGRGRGRAHGRRDDAGDEQFRQRQSGHHLHHAGGGLRHPPGKERRGADQGSDHESFGFDSYQAPPGAALGPLRSHGGGHGRGLRRGPAVGRRPARKWK